MQKIGIVKINCVITRISIFTLQRKKIMDIKEALKDINSSPTPDRKRLEQVETGIKKYLSENEWDVDMWYNLVLLNLLYFHDELGAVDLLTSILHRFNDPRSLIMICHIKEAYMGGIDEHLSELLQKMDTTDKLLTACKGFYLFAFFKNQGDPNCLGYLTNSISLYEDFVHAYIELGYYYKDDLNDAKKAAYYFYKAFSAVKVVLDHNDIQQSNFFDLKNYFDEMIVGIACTQPKYEYIKSLVRGDYPFGL